MREKSPRSNLRKRLLILRKKLERTASFPKKLFLGISPRRLILPPNSLRAAPAGAATCLPARQGKLSLWLPKNQEVQFGASSRNRTCDLLLKRELLYRLSYGRKAKRADLYELWAQTRALYGKIQNNQPALKYHQPRLFSDSQNPSKTLFCRSLSGPLKNWNGYGQK